MSLILSGKKPNNISPLDPGVYSAICVGVVDEGEQYSERFKNYSNKIIIVFEVVDEWVDVGNGEIKPRWLSREYTASLNAKSTLHKELTSWRGKEFTPEEIKGFDASDLVGMGCQLQVLVKESDDRKYNNISGIIGLPKGMKLDPPVSETFVIDLADMAKAEADLEKIPEWMRERVRKSTQWKRAHEEGNEVVDVDIETPAEQPKTTKEMDDIPF